MTKAKKVTGRAKQSTVTLFTGELAPRHWLMTGTALKIGLFATLAGVVAPTPAMAACTLGVNTIVCNDGGGGYPGNGNVFTGDDKVVQLPAGAIVNSGILIENVGNTANFTAHLYGADDGLDPAVIDNDGVTNAHGMSISTSGNIKVIAETGTGITGGNNGQDGLRLRTTGAGTIELDLSGDVTSAGNTNAQAIDVQSTNTKITANLKDGTYTGNQSEAVVINSGTGVVDFDLGEDALITATGNTSVNDHGLWIRSGDTTVDILGDITGVGGSAVVVGKNYNGAVGAAGKVDLFVGDESEVIGGQNGIYVDQGTGAGDVTVTNWGHIEGLDGNGATIIAKGNIKTNNFSLASWIGADDGLNATGNSIVHDNVSGLTWGKSQSGLDIHDIAGVGIADSVVIWNNGEATTSQDLPTSAGIIWGDTNGILINDVALGDIVINNQGWVFKDSNGSLNIGGGLIVGEGNSGVLIDDVQGGSVWINNENTIDPLWPTIAWPSVDDDFITAHGTLAQQLGAGIFGEDYGIRISDVNDGMVGIYNASGIILGENEDGINVDGADGELFSYYSNDVWTAFYLDNNWTAPSFEHGLVWGWDEGVVLNDMDGAVYIDNGGGAIVGGDNGIRITDVWGGDVNIWSYGTIHGLYDDGIYIDEVDANGGVGGWANIDNSGTIIGGDRAIYVNDALGVKIDNDGSIFGQGDWNEPVIRLRQIDDSGTTATATIDNENGGVIASRAIPGLTQDWSIVPGEVPNWVYTPTDLSFLGDFVYGGTAPDSTQLLALADFRDAANDVIVRSSLGGATTVNNNGLMVGRLNLNGNNSTTGNTINNDGLWITRGNTELHGSADGDVINNNSYGLIQTAQDSADTEEAEFVSDVFNNYGVISMVDGGANDTVRIGADTYLGDGGAVAIDVDLSHANLDSDVIRIRDGLLTGQTGVIVRIVDLGGEIGDRVEFARYDDVTTLPDAFVLDMNSDNYVAMGSGGIIADGLLAWYVDQDDYQGFDLVADWGPGAYNAPGIITTAQAAFQSGLGIVEDHMYGKQFGGGGSGADLIVDAPPMVDVAKGTTTSAWAKASGSYLERTATITLDPPGSTTDVTSLTSIGSFLAGVDVTPDGGDIRAGAFGGYTAAYTDFGGAVTEATYGGVSGGGYLAYNNGEMYADVTGKVDYLGVTYNFGGSTAETTALNLGLAANAGYRMSAGNAFVEPLGSLQVLSTSIADVGAFDFSDALSIKAGAGARIGTEIASEGLTTEVSLLARVWNEFGGPNTVTLDDGINATTATENIAGLYGEIAATATFLSLDSGLSGFVTGGATFGATSVEYTAKGGLRVGF